MEKKKIRLLLPFLFLGFLYSCTHLQQDSSMPAISADYPTAEIYACGSHWQGIAMCALSTGENLNDLNFSVQGYFSGTIRVESPDCDFDQSYDYSNSQKVSVSIPGTIQNSACTYGITVSPVYPNETKDPVKVYSFRGFLRVRRIDQGVAWKFATSVIPEGSADALFSLPSLIFTDTRNTLFDGCNIRHQGSISAPEGVFFHLNQIGMNLAAMNQCVIEGIIEGSSSANDVMLSWFVNVFDAKFSPLGAPSIQVSGKNINVSADENVSVISLDGQYVVTQSKSFSFDPAQPHTLRTLTSAGRSSVMDWDPNQKQWSVIRP